MTGETPEDREIREAYAALDTTDERAARTAQVHADLLTRYTRRSLEATRDDPEAGPGFRRAARALLDVPTLDRPSRRVRATDIAHIGMNLGLWPRYSEAVHYAALDLARLIQQGREAEEHYCERVAREGREHEQATRTALYHAQVQAFRQERAHLEETR